MGKSLSIEEKLYRVLKNGASVADIEGKIFVEEKEEYRPAYLNLLKKIATEDIKTQDSIVCFLTLYWLRFNEQTSKTYIPRGGIFLKDQDIPNIVFREGQRVIDIINNGKYTKYDLEFLNYVIEALEDLEIDKIQSLNLLNEIQNCLSSLDNENEMFQKLKLKVVKALEKRKKM